MSSISVVLINKGLKVQLLSNFVAEEGGLLFAAVVTSSSHASVSVQASLNLFINERPIDEPSTIFSKHAYLIVYSL